jgi:hypothetical protein
VYPPGTFTFSKDDSETRYIMLGIRTFIDPNLVQKKWNYDMSTGLEQVA